MNLVNLSLKYGKNMRFWGGISDKVLISGKMNEIRKQVRETFSAAEQGIPFILGPCHSITCGTSYDNFMAILDEYNNIKSRLLAFVSIAINLWSYSVDFFKAFYKIVCYGNADLLTYF